MRRVLLLTIGSFTLGLDAFVVAGILPVIGADLHLSVATVGQMVTVFTLSYALLSPLFATVAAGRSVRGILLLALAVFTLGNVLTALSSTLWVLLLARALAGMGAGLYAPMSATAAVGLLSPERRGRALAMITGGMSSGVVVGVPLGLVLSAHTSWRWTIWLVVALTLVAAIGIAALLPGLRITASAPSLRARAAVLADRRVLAVAGIMICASSTSVGMYTYLSVLLGHTLHPGSLGPYLWTWGVGGLVGSLAVGYVIDRWADTRALVSVINGTLGIALLILPLAAHSVLALLPVLLVWGAAGWGSLAPQQHRMLAIRPEDGAVAVSLNSSAMYLGNAIGSGVGGTLLGAGLPIMVLPLVLGAVAALSAVVNLLVTPPARSSAAISRPVSIPPPPAESRQPPSRTAR
ncbi:MFS transporter [Nocardia sp. alder85J]|uniref:MFS transporter n=1 Tax=Nocardia sp. alder85J TaxID=2862949 RepID=UPI001CD4DDE4|nr:MFS transporter [Nocardia sp. alder85J]MCX4097594.1 MFS transporter [Nocardia sp. alder85J]